VTKDDDLIAAAMAQTGLDDFGGVSFREGLESGLYAWLNEPVTGEFESAMRQWWAENGEYREPSTHPDPEAFGLDLAQVRPLFAEYVARSKAWTTH
jgi:hypothetical protein